MSSNRGDKYANYVPVAERVTDFYALHPHGRVLSTVLEHDRESGFAMVRAEVYRNPDDATPAATGHAYEYKSAGQAQSTSYIEVAETSAIGRAISNLGITNKRDERERQLRDAQPTANPVSAPQSAKAAAPPDDERTRLKLSIDENARRMNDNGMTPKWKPSNLSVHLCVYFEVEDEAGLSVHHLREYAAWQEAANELLVGFVALDMGADEWTRYLDEARNSSLLALSMDEVRTASAHVKQLIADKAQVGA